MAEKALALNNNWSNHDSQNDQTVADLLRQQKNQEQAKQANAETIKSQMTSGNNIQERLVSRVAGTELTKGQGASTKSGSDQDMAEALQQAKNIAQLATNPTPVGIAKMAAQEGIKAFKEGKLGQKMTGELLKQSWMHLVDSFGLTLIYLNIHAWVGFIEGHKVFCKLGDEIKAPGKAKSFMGIFEMIGIILLDFIVLLLILCIISFISWFIGVVSHPIGTLWGALFD